ncbi:hypothetical protein LEP1GSC123_3485 [Leptospira borgpetersenii str. 200701203]|uniref:Uncharacterized protein n=1 Tax=Leptospira borgpetersenii str. 200701203 TaxID=1193007 RepID=M3GVZ1_LEPBO|nr:hypothetical protein LEP1GSC123_3485 [Leptospira borgpetersenii str. 200701203]
MKYILFFAYTIFLLFVKFPVFSAPDRSKSTKLSEEQLLKKKKFFFKS